MKSVETGEMHMFNVIEGHIWSCVIGLRNVIRLQSCLYRPKLQKGMKERETASNSLQ